MVSAGTQWHDTAGKRAGHGVRWFILSVALLAVAVALALLFGTQSTSLWRALVDASSLDRTILVEARLPRAVIQQGILIEEASSAVLQIITLRSTDDSLDEVGLGDFMVRNILGEIRRIPGVGRATLYSTERSLRIWIDPARLVGYGLTEGSPLLAGGPHGDKTITPGSSGKPVPRVEIRIDDPHPQTGIGENIGSDSASRTNAGHNHIRHFELNDFAGRS